MNPFRRIASNIRLPVFRGPNKGVWWSVATSIRDFRGEFVCGKTAAMEHLIVPGDIVWDVGAHQGWTVLLESRLVGKDGTVWAFEPSPWNLYFLEKHLRWNRAENVTLHRHAVGKTDGEATFGWEPGQHHSALCGHLGGAGVNVEVRSIDSLIDKDGAPVPTVLKIDTEGAELDILEGAEGALRSGTVRMVILATHTRDLHEACVSHLAGRGYDIVEARNVDIVREEGWESLGDADVLAVRQGADVSATGLDLFRKIGRVG